MTQEQKAKAYDEVRDKIALRFGSNVADEIFSKFEESEDERIRTAISRILYAQPYRIFTNVGCTEEECLAWLEKQGGQNPAWSEEDKRMIESIIKHLERQKNYQTNTTNIEQCKNWLKSIEDRVQPKQELSENKDFIEFENWFNSYKRKKTWKPTNEQMEMLKHFSLNRKMYPILASLYEDLKKL